MADTSSNNEKKEEKEEEKKEVVPSSGATESGIPKAPFIVSKVLLYRVFCVFLRPC